MAATSLVIIDQVPGITGFDAWVRMFHLGRSNWQIHLDHLPAVYLDIRAPRIVAESPEPGWHAGFEIDSRA